MGESEQMAASSRKRSSIAVGCTSVVAVVAALVFSASALALREHAFSATFGAEGTGNGQFDEPIGVAASASTHDVYVVDRGNARVERFSSSGTFLSLFDGSETPDGAFSTPEGIAIDNSSPPDPSSGDVYVVDKGNKVIDKFTATGVFIAQLTGSDSGPFEELAGVAVDRSGDVWVYEVSGEGKVDEFTDTGAFVAQFGTQRGAEPGFAVDAAGDRVYAINGEPKVGKFNAATGLELAEWMHGASGSATADAVAVDLSTDHIFVDGSVEGVSGIEDYEPFDETDVAPAPTPFPAPLQILSGEGLSESHGIAVDPASGDVYATEREADKVAIFPAFIVPDVTTGSGSGKDTGATLNGVVNPDGLPVTACEFEYGTTTQYGASAPCSQSPTEIGSGTGAVPVSADVTGLAPRTVYHFRLVAANANGPDRGHDATFTTLTPPVVEEESATEVTAGGATLQARINPGGVDTTYQFEYGTTAALGKVAPVPAADAGSQLVGERVGVHAQGLESDTLYYFRITAVNGLGEVTGDLHTVTTQPAGGGSFALPDGRVYELVSPAEKNDGAIPGEAGGSWESSPSGDEVAYSSPYTFANAETGASTEQFYLGSRTVDGWLSNALLPPQAPGCNLCRPRIEMYSTDLARAILVDGGGGSSFGEDSPPLVAGEPQNNANLFLRDNTSGAYRLIDVTPSTTTAAQAGLLGASSDLSHVVFEEDAQLTENAPSGNDLYEWADGSVRLVSVLPDGTPAAEGRLGDGAGHVLRAVSHEGSRIFFTVNGNLYVRQDGTSTVQLDAAQGSGSGGGGRFVGASSDGAKAFFTDDASAGLTEDTIPGSGVNLYEFDANGATLTDLTPASDAQVQGVLGASEDGAYLYFVANGALPGTGGNGEAPTEGEENLYLYNAHSDKPVSFIATLDPTDSFDWETPQSNEVSARVTPDGNHLAFESVRSLTGYDNRLAPGTSCGFAHSGNPLDERCTEVFEYTTGAGLACASCSRSGAAPSGPAVIGAPPRVNSVEPQNYLRRNLSDDGSRVFFDSTDALAASGTSGAENVYEYEQDGAGSCRQTGGCVYLIAAGTAGAGSFFEDATPSGDNVFFTTAQQLAPGDGDTRSDLYDARVGGGFPTVVTPLPCSGETCKPAPSSQPAIFGPLPSETFSGSGEIFPVVPKPAVAPRPETRAQKLTTALKACRRQPKRKRAACNKRARRAFGHARKARKSRKPGR